jgi:hypothetical protein
MSIEHEGQEDDVPAEIAELESQFFGRPRPGRATEQLLWAYALGALSIEDEDKAQALIAGDDKAQEALARIGHSLETRESVTERRLQAAASTEKIARSLETQERERATPVPARAAAPAPSLACRIWGATGEALREAWAAFSLKPEEVVAVFLQKSSGLEVRALLGAEVALEPACLSRGPSLPKGEPEAAPGAMERTSVRSGAPPSGGSLNTAAPGLLSQRRVRMPDGTEVSVVCEPGGGFRLIVSLAGPAIQGLVKARRLVLRDGKQFEEETGVQGRVKDGVATLKECPEGAVKLITPDGRALVLILGRE